MQSGSSQVAGRKTNIKSQILKFPIVFLASGCTVVKWGQERSFSMKLAM